MTVAGERMCAALVNVFRHTPLRRIALQTEQRGRFSSYSCYIEDRTAQIADYLELFGRFGSFEGRVVAELGCSTGYLLDAFQRHAMFTAVGIDRDPIVLRLGSKNYPGIRFVESTDSRIPLPDASVDVAYSIDTLEHLNRPREILLECHRVLRPGGVFLIHFHPWLGPYGSHLEDIIPFPWPHVFFSMETLLATAASIYDSEDYVPACYWFDRETGERRANPYLDVERWGEYLNRMTIRQFQHLLQQLPFNLLHFETVGFGGRRFPLARSLRWLAQFPGLNEFFTRAVFAVLGRAARAES